MAEPTQTKDTPPQGGAPGGAPPQGGAPPEPPKQTPPPEPPKQTPPGVPPPPPPPSGTGDDDDFKLTREQFNSRIAQAKTNAQKQVEDQMRSKLKKMFGTDSDEEIEQKLQAWQELEKDKEERERAAMSEAERLKADLDKSEKARLAAEKKANELQRTYLYEKQDNVIQRLAAPHVNPKYLSFAKKQFATHLKEQGKEAAAKMTEKDISAWFRKDFAKEYPELAVKSNEPPKPPSKKPITNGPGANQPKPPPDKTQQGKTPKPGQKNSMSKSELKEHLKSKGLSGW